MPPSYRLGSGGTRFGSVSGPSHSALPPLGRTPGPACGLSSSLPGPPSSMARTAAILAVVGLPPRSPAYGARHFPADEEFRTPLTNLAAISPCTSATAGRRQQHAPNNCAASHVFYRPSGTSSNGVGSTSFSSSLSHARQGYDVGVSTRSPPSSGAAASAHVLGQRGEHPRAGEGGGKGDKACDKCDKCDGAHATGACPFFRKAREGHPDARAGGRKQLGDDGGRVELLSRARVIRQPGDGSCLFHSLCYGLRDGTTAHALRRQICAFIEANPELPIADSPLREWVLWDSASSVPAYCHKITGGAWGGGIEMAVIAHMKRVAVHVYESRGTGFKRISRFLAPAGGDSKVIRVLYCGGVHYDALALEE